MNTPGVRTCIVDSGVLLSLDRLWAGDLTPADLPKAEAGIRAYLLYEKLVWDKSGAVWTAPQQTPTGFRSADDCRLGEFPLSDGSLIFDFVEDEVPLVTSFGAPPEIVEQIENRVRNEAVAAIPPSCRLEWQMFEYIDRWYEGKPTDEPVLTSVWRGFNDEKKKLTKTQLLEDGGHAIFHLGLRRECEYWLRAYRSGYAVCSVKPLATACEEMIFSKWPNQLFREFGEEYAKSSRELRSPGYYFDLPPLLALVLSRASRRRDIPTALTALRNELKQDRKQLWSLVDELWNAKTRRKQEKVAAALQAAAKNMFPAAFPERRINVLSTALDFATLNWGEAGKQVLGADAVNQNVGSVSFVAKLARIFRKDLRNERDLFWEFFGPVERKRFGE